MRIATILFCVAGFGVLTGPGLQAGAGPGGSPSPQILEEGRQIAKKNCARCHAIELEGESPNSVAPPFRDVVKRYSPWLLAEAFAEGITTGHNEMPAFKFNPEEITSLLSYLESLHVTPDEPTPPQQPSTGQQHVE